MSQKNTEIKLPIQNEMIFSKIVKMLNDKVSFACIPNLILIDYTQLSAKEVSNVFYELLVKNNAFPKFERSKLCVSEFPIENSDSMHYKHYYEKLSKACEYQNRFNGVYHIDFTSIRDIDRGVIQEFLGFIRKSSTSAKFVFENPPEALIYVLENEYNSRSHKYVSNAEEYIKNYCEQRGLKHLTIDLKKEIIDILDSLNQNKWENGLNMIVDIFYESKDIKEFEFELSKKKSLIIESSQECTAIGFKM